MKLDVNDVVKVKINKETAKIDDIGTIVYAFSYPNEAYEVEFVNQDGTVRLSTVFLRDELEPLYKFSE